MFFPSSPIFGLTITVFFLYHIHNKKLNMEKTIKVLNELKTKNLIKDYAIGGGIAAMFYIETTLTYDLDVFIILPAKQNKTGLINLNPIYEYLKKKGYVWKGEHIIIEGIPVQFLPADELTEEAIKNAEMQTYRGEKIKVFTEEYLIAILLKAGRQKDFDKISKILRQGKINKKNLKDILSKYNLIDKFKRITGINNEK